MWASHITRNQKIRCDMQSCKEKNTLFISSANRGIDLDSPVKVGPLVIACPHRNQQRKSAFSKGISDLLKINL